VITSNGYGKQTPLSAYTPKGRATNGISTIDQKALGDIGKIVAARVIQKADDLTIITSNGVAIRIKVKDVRQAGRSTRGVHLIKPQPGDSVASVAAPPPASEKQAQLNGEESGELQPQLVSQKMFHNPICLQTVRTSSYLE
jgi:DNA gyrase subunit A